MRPNELQFWLLLLLVVSATSLVGLFAIWAALARRHWFLRTAMVGGLLCLLAQVPAFELVQIFLAEIASVAIPITGLRLVRHRRVHFRLMDLFLLTAVAAACLWFGKEMPRSVRRVGYWAWGTGCGYAVLAGCAMAMLPQRKRLRAGLLAGLPLAAIAIAPFSWLFLFDAPTWFCYAALPTVAAVVWGSLVLHRAATEPNGAKRVVAQASFAALLLALLLLPAVAYCQMLFPTPVPVATLPTPNAYVELTRLGAELKANSQADRKQLLNAARKALAHDSLIPVNYAPNDLQLGLHVELRTLLRAWAAEGRAAETDGRYDEACETYLDLIRAGAKTSRGGLLAEWILSRQFLREGLEGIQRVRGRLSPSKLRQACAELQSLEPMLERVGTAIQHDQIYAQHAYGWQARIRFLPIFDFDTERFKRMEGVSFAQIRLLECDLAARCFQQQHGAPPERLDELVPGWLPAAPLDPFSGRPLIYRREANGFLIYSVGPDQIDDGGVRDTSELPSAGEDVLLISAERS